MALRLRKLSMPLEFKQMAPTKRVNQEQINDNFYQKPYARCIDCLEFKTRCHKCFNKILDTLKGWKDEQKVKLKEPLKTKRKSKIMIGKNQNSFNISNFALKKTQQNAQIVTFQQPVIHKNTILYCMKPFESSPQPKIRSLQVSPIKYRRNLFVNYSYRNDNTSFSKRLQEDSQIFTEIQDINKQTKNPNSTRMLSTFALHKKSVGASLSMNCSRKEFN